MLLTGTEVGGYRIEGVLGRGGMGVVYEAVQLSLGRTIALKVLAAELSDDSAFRERFRREARTQAIIEHAHIVPVYEAGEIDEGLYIAMRLVRGSNLKQLVTAGELTTERTLKILLAVGDALDTAHESDLIHRDIKPQNILVGRRDHAFLADFGLTKGKSDTGYTKTGQLMGTLDYVSPEQVKGELATTASDIYALAAVTYECLVGRPPFSRPTELATLYAHVSDPPPLPSQERPGLPRAIDEIIVAGLAKNPAERPPTALEMLTALEQALRPPASPPSSETTTAVILPPPADPTPTVPAPPVAGDGQATEIVTPAGTPTREDLRREWSPEAAAAAADVAPEERERARRERRDAAAREAAERERREAAERERQEAAAREAAERERQEATAREAAERERHEATAREAAQRQRREAAKRAERARRREARQPLAGRTLAVALAAALGVAALAGVVAGGAAQDDPEPAAPAERAPLRAGAVALDAPAGWRAGAKPATHGLRYEGRAATARSGAATITIGMTAGSGPTLLPAPLDERAGRPGEPVRLGDLEAYRYDGLASDGAGAPLTVYAAPTDAGVATVSCAGASAEDCGAAAASLALDGVAPLPLGPRKAYANRISGPVRRLQQQRARATRTLARADAPGGQARAAGAVADAYATAARRLAAIDPAPLEADAHAALVAALRGARKSWSGLASDARAQRRSAYERGRSGAARADDRVRAALLRLRELGYEVG